MKKTFIMILSLIYALSATASASVFDTAVFNRDKNTVTVSGNSDNGDIGNIVTVYAINTTEDKIDETSSNIEHIANFKVENYRPYTYTFGFDDIEGKYYIGAVDEKGNRKSVLYDYYSDGTLNTFAINVGKSTMSDSEILAGLKLYAQSLNIDGKMLDNQRDTDIFLDYIDSADSDLVSEGLPALEVALEKAMSEISLINAIETANYWYEIDELIESNTALIGIDETVWKNSSQRQTICSNLMDETIKNLSSLSDYIDKELYGDDTDDDTETSKRPSGGNGGGGTMSFNDPYTADTIPTLQNSGFTDLDGVEWAKEAILSLSKEGIINGIGNQQFSPNTYVKREELAKMIVLAFDIDMSDKSSGFTDVQGGSWYAPYVYSLVDSGVSNGISDSIFGTGINVTRQDIAVILYRLMNNKGYLFNGTKASFNDIGDASEYAVDAVEVMAANGIINGTGNGNFAPKQCATRAQAAKLIYEVKNRLAKGE